MFQSLETAGSRIAEALLSEAKSKGIPLTINQAGSMFAIFFNEGSVESFDDVQQSDTRRFSRFFHSAMKKGVYLPPSAYETCFLSTAHDEATLDRAIESLVAALHDSA